MALDKKPVPVASRVVRPEPVLLSILDAAAILAVSSKQVIKMLRLGWLPQVRIGRRVMIARTDLDQFIADNRSGGGAKKTA